MKLSVAFKKLTATYKLPSFSELSFIAVVKDSIEKRVRKIVLE